jgi:uncharacterized protein YlxW (UPF0749 family)
MLNHLKYLGLLIIPITLGSLDILDFFTTSVIVVCMSWLISICIKSLSDKEKSKLVVLNTEVEDLKSFTNSLLKKNTDLKQNLNDMQKRIEGLEVVVKSVSFGKDDKFTSISSLDRFKF